MAVLEVYLPILYCVSARRCNLTLLTKNLAMKKGREKEGKRRGKGEKKRNNTSRVRMFTQKK
jgi:hypothetical protein